MKEYYLYVQAKLPRTLRWDVCHRALKQYCVSAFFAYVELLKIELEKKATLHAQPYGNSKLKILSEFPFMVSFNKTVKETEIMCHSVLV